MISIRGHLYPRFRKNILPLLILLLLILLLLGKELFSPTVLGSTYPDTDISYYLRIREYAFHQEAPFPKWNVLSMCGAPLIAEIQSGLFYPPNVIFLFLSVPQAINISIFLHLYLLAVFMYFFARQTGISEKGAMVSAIVISLCGPVVLRIFAGHLSNIYTITWIPLILLIVDRIGKKPYRKYFVLLGIVFALQILAGHIQYFFYSVLFAAGFFVFNTFHLLRDRKFKEWGFCVLGFCLALLLAFSLALPQLVPTLEMLSLSARTALSYRDVAQFSFPLENLLTLFAPTVFGDMTRVSYWGMYNLWEMCIYSGILPLLLTVLAIYKKKGQQYVHFFFFTAIIALLIGLGIHTPFLKIFYHLIPGFRLFRGHSKILIILCFCIASLAGIGFDRFAKLKRERRRIFKTLFICLMAASLLTILFINYSGLFKDIITSMLKVTGGDPRRYLPVPESNNAQFVQSAITAAVKSVTLSIVLFFISCSLIFIAKYTGSSKALQTSAIFLICMDMFFFASRFVFAVDPKAWDLKHELMQFLKKDKTLYRVAVLTSHGEKYGSTSSLQEITSAYPCVLKRYSKLYNLVNIQKPLPTMKIVPIRVISPIYNLFNLKYLILDSGKELSSKGYKKVYDDGDFIIYENTNCLDRTFISHRVKIAGDEDSALRYLSEPETISGLQIVLEKDVSNKMRMDSEKGMAEEDFRETAQITEYKPDLIRINANMAQDRWLCLADTFYPGWEAIIDDTVNAEIFIANYLFRTVYVPEGQHEITFRYIPRYYSISKSISITAAILTGIYLLVNFFFYSRPRKQILTFPTLSSKI